MRAAEGCLVRISDQDSLRVVRFPPKRGGISYKD